jgi:hypothetical protein
VSWVWPLTDELGVRDPILEHDDYEQAEEALNGLVETCQRDLYSSSQRDLFVSGLHLTLFVRWVCFVQGQPEDGPGMYFAEIANISSTDPFRFFAFRSYDAERDS